MRTISTSNLGPKVQALLKSANTDDLPRSLPFQAPLKEFRGQLESIQGEDISGGGAKDASYATCLHSGLWLLFDFMPESHALSQQVHHASGSYWHGILHRREPDAGNARYWFSKVGEHPVFEELKKDACEIIEGAGSPALKNLAAGNSWDPDEFIKLCTTEQNEATTQTLLKIQRREWELLFDYDFQKAFGE